MPSFHIADWTVLWWGYDGTLAASTLALLFLLQFPIHRTKKSVDLKEAIGICNQLIVLSEEVLEALLRDTNACRFQDFIRLDEWDNLCSALAELSIWRRQQGRFADQRVQLCDAATRARDLARVLVQVRRLSTPWAAEVAQEFKTCAIKIEAARQNLAEHV
ncbi:hypothetical protein [Caballeronia pedi]|uniref:hypothetical protein n=1 Tax=Caballeronia pedi TaxID=1777141 RepID=UPI000772C139|nr:hypothetical protein [Caballeronia pedi]